MGSFEYGSFTSNACRSNPDWVRYKMHKQLQCIYVLRRANSNCIHMCGMVYLLMIAGKIIHLISMT